MALTYGQPMKVSVGGRWLTLTNVTGDTKYPTGGYTLEASKLGLPDALLDFAVTDAAIPSGGATSYLVNINEAAKLQLYQVGASNSAAMAELAAETNVSTFSMNIIAVGR